MARIRFLAVMAALAAVAACAPAGDDEGAEAAGAAASEGTLRLDVGVEASRPEPVLTMGHPSVKNMYALATIAGASYLGGVQLHDALCEAGLHVTGARRCVGPGDHVDAELATFDTAADDHAIYVRAKVPTEDGPRDVAVLAFRGTASRANVLTDAKATRVDSWGARAAATELLWKNLPGAAHAGFDEAASRLFKGDTRDTSLRRFLRERHLRPDAPPLYLTGHSLGGALATVTLGYLLFGECASIDPEERFSMPRATTDLAWSLPGTSCPAKSALNVQALYTYGSPRVGDAAFAEGLANMMALRRIAHFRVVNANDLVARVAPRVTGYSHLHLNIHGLSETDREGVTRGFSLREDENADAVYGDVANVGTRIRRCRQWDGATDNPSECPTRSLAYLLPGEVDRDRSQILRLGEGVTQALDDNATMIPRAVDHKLGNYIPLLRRLADGVR